MATGIQIEQLLLDVLTKHSEKGAALLQLVKEERSMIIHADLEKMKHAMQEKLELKESITKLEEYRLKLMPHFAKKYAVSGETMTLSLIIEKTSESYSDSFRELQKSLRKTFKAVQRMHDGNKILISRSVAFQEKSFMLLYGIKNQQVRYEKSGQVTQDRKPLIDSVM